MRIGIDGRLWNETGVGRYIRNLVRELKVLDKKNTYVLFVGEDCKIDELSNNKNWKVIQTPIRWHTLEEQRKLPNLLKSEHLDLVHFPYFSVPVSYNLPFIITIHDLIINHYPTGKASTLPSPVYYAKLLGYKYVIKKATIKAKKIITVSQATKDEIEEHLSIPPDKIAVTYEGISENIFGKNQNTHLPFDVEKYFLYVGNAYPHKNLERLIEAFKLVLDEYKDVTLVLVGKEDYFYRNLKKKVHELGIEKNVLFAGFISEETLQYCYKNAIATIVPSLMEGFGLPGLEAMRADCLVLASDIPSLKEIYADSAIYFNPLAVESMHATIREVLTDKNKFNSYIGKGEKRVTFFSWRKMAEQTLKIYESSTGIRPDK
jgi:glycosyltransferase involved in cell wall biosynthesis